MQLASITFDGEKKNSNHYIIPPSYFKTKGITAISVSKPEKFIEEKSNLDSIPKERAEENIKVEEDELLIYSSDNEELEIIEEPKVKLNLNISTQRTSGLSLKSIKAKKEHQIRQMDVVIDDRFTS